MLKIKSKYKLQKWDSFHIISNLYFETKSLKIRLPLGRNGAVLKRQLMGPNWFSNFNTTTL